MIPENGKFKFLSHVTLDANNTPVPVGTTHIMCGTATATNIVGILGAKFDGSTLVKLLVPLGVFFRLSNVVGGLSNFLTEGTGVVSTVTSVTFFKWEQ